MTHDEWLAKTAHLIAESEGLRTRMYHDTVGVPTIGVGQNLQNVGAASLLRSVGVTNPNAVIAGQADITVTQALAMFQHVLPTYIAEARLSLPPGIFDKLGDARRFVVVDLTYNLGAAGWSGFVQTRHLLAQAVQTHDMALAHQYYLQVADHLQASVWASQVGIRAVRDVQMMRTDLFPGN